MDLASASVIGSAAELRRAGQLVGKVGSLPVVVFWHADRPWAVEDRCPHMGDGSTKKARSARELVSRLPAPAAPQPFQLAGATR